MSFVEGEDVKKKKQTPISTYVYTGFKMLHSAAKTLAGRV